MPLEKLLSEYFQKPELQQACYDIDEPTSYNSPELITIILNEWENKGRSKYELFEYLDRQTLSRICKAYKIEHKGDFEVLLKRIKKKKLLDNSHTKIKIGGIGAGTAFGIILFLISPFYADFIEQFNQPEVESGIEDSEQIFQNIGSGEFKIINSTIINEQNVFQKSEIVSEECESGERGMIYVDCELGFEVTRPDTTWEFIENILGDAKSRGINMVTSDYYLGGVLIGSNTRAGVLIVVYDGNDPTRKDLRQYVESLEKSFAESYHMVAVHPSIVSADDDSARFLARVIDGDRIFHYEEKTELHNDKFYTMIAYFWNDISPLEQYGKELQAIVKSIKYQE